MIDADIETAADMVSEPVNERAILAIAKRQGEDISALFTKSELANLGSDVVRDYETDDMARKAWKDIAVQSLKDAAQDQERTPKSYPFENASDIKYPLLTVAAMQFQARAYPAIFKGDEVVQVKVVGSDKGRVQKQPDGQPVVGPDGKPEWQVPPGYKAARAQRVREYMNVCVAYRMDGWEADTDAMLLQLPIVGCAFRKCWWDARNGKQRPAAAFVSALRLVVPNTAKSIDVAPRVTEEIPDIYPYEIRAKMRSGWYREIELTATDANDTEAPRLLLEQYRYLDLDDDGLDEPYIVTVDKETMQVLRVEPNYGPESLHGDPDTGVIEWIEAGKFYIKYPFIPNPSGEYYDLGFGHLLSEIAPVIDTAINQTIDAGHAEIAGGGFIASGLRLQGNGQSSRLQFRLGEYKVVSAPAGALRDAIWERTMPRPSEVTFKMLDLMLGAAKDIAAIKDVTSGDASNMGQVGTTLALIEQGLQVFTAIYKRVYRALREEFQALYVNIGRYGDAQTERDYIETLDDDAANFRADFNANDMDIRPVSDPGSVTRTQKMARAQFLLGMRGMGLNDMEIMARVLEAADIEDAEKLLPPADAPPPPQAVAELEKLKAEVEKLRAAAALDQAKVAEIGSEIGHKMGEADAIAGTNAGGVPSMAGPPDNAMGDAGGGAELPGAPGLMDGDVMGGGEVGPPDVAGIADAS